MSAKVIRIEIRITRRSLVLGICLALLLVALPWSLARVADAASATGESARRVLGATRTTAAPVGHRIHYQGRLEGASGPVEMTFRMWSDATSTAPGDLVWEETQIVTPTDDLFSVQLGAFTDLDAREMGGQALWLGVEVEGDGEMVPRQEILPVPYALSLRPGAWIAEDGIGTVLTVHNEASPASVYGGRAAIVAHSSAGVALMGSNETGAGVWGRSESGVAIMASSDTGADLRADGTGIVQSVADTTVWVPGTSAMVRIGTSGLDILYHGDGIARLRASSAGEKQIVLPIVVPAVLYGQPTTVEELRIRWRCAPDTTIESFKLYRSEGGGASQAILDTGPLGCSGTSWITWDYSLDSPDNVLDTDSGMLAFELTLDMQAGSDREVWLGGIRLRLGHDAE